MLEQEQLSELKTELENFAKKYTGCLICGTTHYKMQHELNSIINYFVAKHNLSRGSCNVDPIRKRNLLAEQCESLEEYKMKSVIMNGCIPEITQQEFDAEKWSNDLNGVNIHVSLQPSPQVKYVVVDQTIHF